MDEKKLDGLSFDNVRARIEELKRMFPEAVHEGRLDYDTLMALLGDEFDNEGEKYQFTWKGKLNALRLAQKRSSGTLRPDFEESRDFTTTGNLYLEGDNLEVLKLLQQGYLRKVKMIYIDPPYNTGNDFVYEDDFADPIAKYKEITGQGMRANPETAGRYHSNWLNMMYPRLKIAKTLLRDDGVIFISMDDNEQANLKKLCDEVFGEENFVTTITWEKRYSPQNAVQWFSEAHDFILIYAKRKEMWPPNLLERSEEINARYRNLDNDLRGVWKPTDATAQAGHGTASQFYELVAPNGQSFQPPSGRCWVYTKDRMLEMIEDDRVWFGSDGKSAPTIKRFLTDVKQGIACQTIWKYENVGHNQEGKKEIKVLFPDNVPFDTPKPTRLVKRILQLCTNLNDNNIILDFFSGSATTAHAVMQLNAEDGGNRKYIMVQIPEPTDENSEVYKAGYRSISDIGKERIRRAGDKIMAEWREKQSGQLSLESSAEPPSPPDIGFRVFKLDSSNLQKWDDSYVTSDQLDLLYQRMEQRLDRFKHDRRDIDVVYEVFLKYGVPLTEKLSMLEIQGKKFYVVGEHGDLFVCLDDGLTVEVIQEAARYAPKTMIFADNAFVDDNEIINAGLVLEKAKIEFRWV